MFEITINFDGRPVTAYASTKSIDLDEFCRILKWRLADGRYIQNTGSVTLFGFKSITAPTSGTALVMDLNVSHKFPVTIKDA